MAITTTLRSWSAMRERGQLTVLLRAIFLGLGAFFAALTARVLLWEIRGPSDLSVEHYLTIGAMVGAIASGIYFGHMLHQLKLFATLGLGIAFVAATTYCLIGSAGRSDELAFEHNAAARQVNKDRERAQRNRDEARRRYDAALDAEASECSGGAGPKCLAKRAITQERRSDFEVAELLLQKAKPEQRENGKLKRAAQVIALMTNATEDGAERGLVIVWPFLPPFICELLTIVFLHLGFAHRRPKQPPETVSRLRVGLRGGGQRQTQSFRSAPHPDPLPMEHGNGKPSPETEAETVRAALALAGRPVSNDELAFLLGVTKGEASKRVSALSHSVIRERRGREVAISLRRA